MGSLRHTDRPRTRRPLSGQQTSSPARESTGPALGPPRRFPRVTGPQASPSSRPRPPPSHHECTLRSVFLTRCCAPPGDLGHSRALPAANTPPGLAPPAPRRRSVSPWLLSPPPAPWPRGEGGAGVRLAPQGFQVGDADEGLGVGGSWPVLRLQNPRRPTPDSLTSPPPAPLSPTPHITGLAIGCQRAQIEGGAEL